METSDRRMPTLSQTPAGVTTQHANTQMLMARTQNLNMTMLSSDDTTLISLGRDKPWLQWPVLDRVERLESVLEDDECDIRDLQKGDSRLYDRFKDLESKYQALTKKCTSYERRVEESEVSLNTLINGQRQTYKIRLQHKARRSFKAVNPFSNTKPAESSQTYNPTKIRSSVKTTGIAASDQPVKNVTFQGQAKSTYTIKPTTITSAKKAGRISVYDYVAGVPHQPIMIEQSKHFSDQQVRVDCDGIAHLKNDEAAPQSTAPAPSLSQPTTSTSSTMPAIPEEPEEGTSRVHARAEGGKIEHAAIDDGKTQRPRSGADWPSIVASQAQPAAQNLPVSHSSSRTLVSSQPSRQVNFQHSGDLHIRVGPARPNLETPPHAFLANSVLSDDLRWAIYMINEVDRNENARANFLRPRFCIGSNSINGDTTRDWGNATTMSCSRCTVKERQCVYFLRGREIVVLKNATPQQIKDQATFDALNAQLAAKSKISEP